MQVSETTSGSPATLQSLINTVQPAVVDSANAAAFAEQAVLFGQIAPNDFEPLAPQAPALSDQFSPASLAFLTSTESFADTPSGTLAAVSALALNRDLINLNAALEQIQGAVSGSAPTQAAHTIALV